MAVMNLRFRPLRRTDFGMLAQWLAAPHVQAWWREPSTLEAVAANYGPSVDGADPTEHFVIESDGVAIGLIQRCRLGDAPEYLQAMQPAGAAADAATLDYLIGDPDRIGQGLGPALIADFARLTWRRYPDAPAIVIAVQQDNRRSWRALEKAGFERVWSGVVESGDPSDEGPSYVYVLHRPA
jgi:aminoglycoside 6'-N-acetyltransferase